MMEKAGLVGLTKKSNKKESRVVTFSTKLLEKYDLSKTGSLSYEEFRALMNGIDKIDGMEPMEEEELKETFSKFDENHDGKVSLEEIATYFREGCGYAFESEVDFKDLMEDAGLDKKSNKRESRVVTYSTKLLEKYDLSKTGSLSYEEF